MHGVSSVCFLLYVFIGLFVINSSKASEVLSGASTAISIVLSIVAILYTMIEGASSAQINQESKSQLIIIEKQLKEVTEKMEVVSELDRRIRYVAPHLENVVQEIERSPDKTIDDSTKYSLECVMKYVQDDLDE